MKLFQTVVMIPCRNEQETIGHQVADLVNAGYAVVVANDGSTDETEKRALMPGVTVARVPPTRAGLTGVYTYGLKMALEMHPQAQVVVEMDAGGSHHVGDLEPLVDTVAHGADVAFGRRFGGGGAKYIGDWKRRALSYMGTQVTNLLHRDHRWADATSGFIAYRRRALVRLLEMGTWDSTGHYYQTEMRLRAVKAGLRCVEVPIVYKNSGTSLNWRSIAEAARLAVWSAE